jgi:hypothetical protein
MAYQWALSSSVSRPTQRQRYREAVELSASGRAFANLSLAVEIQRTRAGVEDQDCAERVPLKVLRPVGTPNRFFA